jgi:hypothetical protein
VLILFSLQFDYFQAFSFMNQQDFLRIENFKDLQAINEVADLLNFLIPDCFEFSFGFQFL